MLPTACQLCEANGEETLVAHMLRAHPREVNETAARLKEKVRVGTDFFTLINDLKLEGPVNVFTGIKGAGIFTARCSGVAAAALLQETQAGRLCFELYDSQTTFCIYHGVRPQNLTPVTVAELESRGGANKVAREDARRATYYVPVVLRTKPDGRHPMHVQEEHCIRATK